jgi:hypothetical protein
MFTVLSLLYGLHGHALRMIPWEEGGIKESSGGGKFKYDIFDTL